MAKRERPQQFLTPIGVLRFPKLHPSKPDDYEGKKAWKTHIILTADDAAKVIATIDANMHLAQALVDQAEDKAAKARRKLKKTPAQWSAYESVVDPDSGEETGEVVFKLAKNATWKDKDGIETKSYPASFFDAKGKPYQVETDKDRNVTIDGVPSIRGGTRARLSYHFAPFFNEATGDFGLSMKLDAVKIIELRGGGQSAADFGFDDDESEEGAETETEATDRDLDDEIPF